MVDCGDTVFDALIWGAVKREYNSRMRAGHPVIVEAFHAYTSVRSCQICAQEGMRYYLTRSASVTGLLGRAANLLISSSEICAEEGGCDQVGIAGGDTAADVYHRILFNLTFKTGLQPLNSRSAIRQLEKLWSMSAQLTSKSSHNKGYVRIRATNYIIKLTN